LARNPNSSFGPELPFRRKSFAGDFSTDSALSPMLASLYVHISEYFKSFPIPLDPQAIVPSGQSKLSFREFQNQCQDYISNNTLVTDQFTEEQKARYEQILAMLQDILDFPKKAKQPKPSLETFEALLTVSRKMTQGKHPDFKPKVLGYIEQIMGDPSQRKKNREDEDLEEILEKLRKISVRLESQAYEWKPENDKLIKSSALSEAIEKSETRRIAEQDWVNPQIQKNNDLETLGGKIDKLSKDYQGQKYYVTESMIKKMYVAKIKGHLETLGRPKMEDQRAMTPTQLKNHKFEEVTTILNKLPPRIDDQSAIKSGTSLVERMNTNIDQEDEENKAPSNIPAPQAGGRRRSIIKAFSGILFKDKQEGGSAKSSCIVLPEEPPVQRREENGNEELLGRMEKIPPRISGQTCDAPTMADPKQRDVLNLVSRLKPRIDSQSAVHSSKLSMNPEDKGE